MEAVKIDLVQLQKDRDQGVLICNLTWDKLLQYAQSLENELAAKLIVVAPPTPEQIETEWLKLEAHKVCGLTMSWPEQAKAMREAHVSAVLALVGIGP